MTVNDLSEINLKTEQRWLRNLETQQKDLFLNQLAEALLQDADSIFLANKKDLEALPSTFPESFRDRLMLNPSRLQLMADSLKAVASLVDPVGEIVETKKLDNGLQLQRVRSPLGVILFIFESRPNVITEAFSLAWKSGNAIALRGGKESKHTALCIQNIMQKLFQKIFGLSKAPFQFLVDFPRERLGDLLLRKDLFDVVVPRGGDALIEFVTNNSRIPVIKNDRGMCHAFVDESANLRQSMQVVYNAKVSRPGVCNSLETVLVHKNVAQSFIPMLFRALRSKEVLMKCCKESYSLLNQFLEEEDKKYIQLAEPRDFDIESLDLILNCKIVASLDEAIQHIEAHGSKHSECILTSNEKNKSIFFQSVDAAVLYWNASTRFTDGYEFGLGGELGISTQKLHVRGPVGLRELTSTRWLVEGAYTVR